MQETRVWSLGWEDSLRVGKGNWHIFFLGESHGQRSLVGYNPQGHRRVGHDLVTKHQQQQSPRSVCWQSHATSAGSGEGSIPGLSPSFWWLAGNFLYSVSCRHITMISAFLFMWHFPFVCVCLCPNLSFFYKDINHIGLEMHTTPVWSHLNYICKDYFQIRSHSEVWDNIMNIWGGTEFNSEYLLTTFVTF